MKIVLKGMFGAVYAGRKKNIEVLGSKGEKKNKSFHFISFFVKYSIIQGLSARPPAPPPRRSKRKK